MARGTPLRSGTRNSDRIFVCSAAGRAARGAKKACGEKGEASGGGRTGRKGKAEKDPRGGLRPGLVRLSLLGVGLGVSILAACALSEAMIESPLFVVARVEVEDAGRFRPDEVRSMSGIRSGMNLVTLDTGEVSRRLEADRWIRNATVVKKFPDCVLIKLRMRKPVAVIGIRGDLYYLGGDGTVLSRIRPGEALDFPVITGLDMDVGDAHRYRGGRELQQVMGLLRALLSTPGLGPVSEIHLDPSKGLYFVLEKLPSRVYVGWGGFSEKASRLGKILPEVASRGGGIESIDLRFSAQIVVRGERGQNLKVSEEGRAEARAGSASSIHRT